jgi:EAL domain-containing protein (putative c-di-GMP-specific phosphodiesterase class I)
MGDRPRTIDYRTGYLKMRSVLYDRATGLPAFPLLFDQLRTWLDDRRSIGVLHLEIAELEMVESLYGWQVFDRIVAHTARALGQALGTELPADSLLGLNGVAGDRFVVFVREVPGGAECDGAYLAAAAGEVAARLERAFDSEAFVGLNPGVCFRTGHALLQENPFYRFERCVYAAVDEARGAHARREERRERSWGEELRGIIRKGSVRAVFQPVVDLQNGDILGHEALTRGPRDSLFEAPRAMFALSERVGVADELDRLCYESALAASCELSLRGKLFINLRHAAPQSDREHLTHLQTALERHGLEPGDLVLEVSERATGAEPEHDVERLRELKSAGFAVALDDVGTGRTRLKVIRRIEPDYLKVDLSLVRNLQESLMQREVLVTLVELAGAIDATVIAEGVESEAEAAALIESGVRYGQGHLFAMPAPARELRPAPRGGPRDH